MDKLKDSIIHAVESAPEIRWTSEALAPWSNSSTKLLEKCPMKLLLTKVLHVELPDRQPDDDSMLRRAAGLALHQVLEYRLSGQRAEDAVAAAEASYGNMLPGEEWNRVTRCLPNVDAFMGRVFDFKMKNMVEEVHVEKKLAITRDLKATEFDSPNAFWRGILDLLMVLPTLYGVNIDHKSGGVANSSWRVYARQMNGCSVLVHYGLRPVRGMQQYINYIQAGVLRKGPYVCAENIHGVLARDLFAEVDYLVDRVRRRGFLARRAGNSMCQYCEFNDVCKTGFLRKEVEPRTKNLILRT